MYIQSVNKVVLIVALIVKISLLPELLENFVVSIFLIILIALNLQKLGSL